MKFLPLRTHSLWLLTKWALALVWFRVPLRVGNGKILTPAPLSVPSALLFVFVVAASNCRQTTNAKGKEKFKASCFSVPDKVRMLCCTLTISAKGWWTFQTQFVVMEMVIYVREVNVCPPPSDSENPVRTHQPRGRAQTVWGQWHKPHAINCDPVLHRSRQGFEELLPWERWVCVSQAHQVRTKYLPIRQVLKVRRMFWSKKENLVLSGPCCV